MPKLANQLPTILSEFKTGADFMKLKFVWALLLLSLTEAFSQEITVGRTWDITEPDPIAEAQRRAENVSPKKLTPRSSFRHRLAAKNIQRVAEPLERTYTPLHTLEREILNRDGGVLYPAGFTYNPIKYMHRYNRRIVIIDEIDAQKVKPYLKPSDIVIVNRGDLKNTSEIIGQRADMLDILTAESMNILRVPVVVTIDYDNFYYRLMEFNPNSGVPL